MLGRIVEVLRGKPFDDCMREHLFTPLGLTHAANGPYEAILYPRRRGSLQPAPTRRSVPAPVWALARSNAPAGSMLAMRPRDLITFARMHMDGGRAPDGTQVLSADAVASMYRPAVELPHLGVMGDTWGLGPELFTWADAIARRSRWQHHRPGRVPAVPAPRTAWRLALLTNGGDTFSLYRDIATQVFGELVGVTLPPLLTPPAEPQAHRRPPIRRHVLHGGRWT